MRDRSARAGGQLRVRRCKHCHTGVFQATEGGVQSLLRVAAASADLRTAGGMAVRAPAAAGVWLAFPIAEVLTAVIAAVLLRHTAGKGRLSQQDHAASLSK